MPLPLSHYISLVENIQCSNSKIAGIKKKKGGGAGEKKENGGEFTERVQSMTH